MRVFPFLFGRAFIEAQSVSLHFLRHKHFPSFSEGLSLRPGEDDAGHGAGGRFPFLLGRAFTEAGTRRMRWCPR